MKLLTAPRAQPISILAAAVVLAGACGYPTFSFEPAGTTTSTAATSTGTGGTGNPDGSTTGSGGEAATSSVSATASSGTGGEPACVVTHKGMGACEYLPGSECGCPDPTTKCAVVDEATGASDCIKIGTSPRPVWSGCDTDNDCAATTWCDLQRHVCKPICDVLDDCPGGASCVPVPQKNMVSTPIPGLKACTSHCAPQSAMPCGSGLTCTRNAGGEFDCVKSQNKVEGTTCTASAECFKGLLCIGAAQSFTCEKWCSPANAMGGGCVGTKPYCSSFQTAVEYNMASYGYCDASP